MDNEMREAVRDLREQVITGYNKIDGKVDGIIGSLASHTVESATRTVRIEEMAKAAHKRLDGHMKGHWWVLGIIGTIISTVGGAIAIALFKMLALK